MKKYILDLGANIGDDVPYYLQKYDFVVLVEANPVLADQLKIKYKSDDVIVLNNVIVSEELRAGFDYVPFYIHRLNHALSQFPEPAVLGDFEKVILPVTSLNEIFILFGKPDHIKIDIENYDKEILKSLISSSVLPMSFSFECQDEETFALLEYFKSYYDSFTFIHGYNLKYQYSGKTYTNKNSELRRHCITRYTSGPVPSDIRSFWYNYDDLSFLFKYVYEFGWVDIVVANGFSSSKSKWYRRLLLLIIHYGKKFQYGLLRIMNRLV